MIELKNLCLGCMSDIGDEPVCPVCGWKRGEKQDSPLLPESVDVGGRYIVGKCKHSGGDGNTYIAWDLDMQKEVYLREFLPAAIASRDSGDTAIHIMSGCEKVFSDCRASFYSLWDKIVKLNGLSSLITAKEVVSDYGTLYAVLENKDYITLDEYLPALPNRRMKWDSLRPVIMPLLSTVATLHAAGIIHGGISPSTIYVSKDGRFFIGGFNIIQVRCSVGDLNAELYPGYSAAEQYGARQKIGSWSDVYALAAVIFRCLVGEDPIPSSQRLVRDELMIPGSVANALPPAVLNAVINALQTKPENRTVDIEEMRAELLGQPVKKQKFPLSYYNYNDISYVNQDKKPYVAQTEFFTSGNGIPKPAERGGANVSRTYTPSNGKTPAPAQKTTYEDESKGGAGKGIAAAVIIILVAALAAVIVYFSFFSDFTLFSKEPKTTVTTTQATAAVPNFTGRTEVSLKSDAALREQFSLVYQQEYSVEAAAGYVIRQSVNAGTVLPVGSEIIIYISLGPKDLVVPNVIGIEANQAKTQLEAMGFAVQMTEKANDGTGTAGYVASVVPDVGTDSRQGETVYLHVWGAPPTTEPPTTASIFGGGSSGNSGGGLFGWFQ